MLVVDDGSTDETHAIALANGAVVLHAPLWQGAWGAIQTGLRYAVRHGYSGVVTLDADGQHEPDYLPQLIEAGRSADVVIAACPSRGSVLRHIAWRYFRFLTGLSIEDLTSGFRYYNARACRLLAGPEATLLDYQDVGVLLLLLHADLRVAEVSGAHESPPQRKIARVLLLVDGRALHGGNYVAVPGALESASRKGSMKNYYLVVLIIGIGLAIGILYLVRRDHLYIRQGFFWILVAATSLLFGIWPSLIDFIGGELGIAYPPTLLLLVAIVALVVKALLGDIAFTRLSRDIRRLNQRIALLEAENPSRETDPAR